MPRVASTFINETAENSNFSLDDDSIQEILDESIANNITPEPLKSNENKNIENCKFQKNKY